MSLFQSFDSLNISRQGRVSRNTQPRYFNPDDDDNEYEQQQTSMLMDAEAQGGGDPLSFEEPPPVPPPPPPLPIFKRVKLGSKRSHFIPASDDDFKQIHNLRGDTLSQAKALEKHLYEQYELGTDNYSTECELKRIRELSGYDEQAQREGETIAEYLIRRARYWEERDAPWCFPCSHTRGRRSEEQFPDLKCLENFIHAEFHTMSVQTLINSVYDIYNYLLRHKHSPMYIDVYTGAPRPKRYWSKAQIHDHIFEHVLDIVIQQEKRLKTYINIHNELEDEMKSEDTVTGEVRLNYQAIRLALEVQKSLKDQEKQVLINRRGR